jgi:hypothetical protein
MLELPGGGRSALSVQFSKAKFCFPVLVVVAELLVSGVRLSAGPLAVMVKVFRANSAFKHDGKVFKGFSASENVITNSHDFSPSNSGSSLQN